MLIELGTWAKFMLRPMICRWRWRIYSICSHYRTSKAYQPGAQRDSKDTDFTPEKYWPRTEAVGNIIKSK